MTNISKRYAERYCNTYGHQFGPTIWTPLPIEPFPITFAPPPEQPPKFERIKCKGHRECINCGIIEKDNSRL